MKQACSNPDCLYCVRFTRPARPLRYSWTARTLQIHHELTLSRYFERPVLVASVTLTQNTRASGRTLLYRSSRWIPGDEWLS